MQGIRRGEVDVFRILSASHDQPLATLRLIKNQANFSLNVYWTRLQVGVRDKRTKKQVWTTTCATATPSFPDKIRLANAIAAFLQLG